MINISRSGRGEWKGEEEVVFKISQTKIEWLWKSAGLTPEINI